jgi:hemerythrin
VRDIMSVRRIQWKEEYNLGISSVDEQHRRLFDLMNVVFKGMQDSETKSGLLEKVFNDLVDYIDYHFRFEEDLMKKYGYTDLRRHQNIHYNFSIDILEAQKNYILEKKKTVHIPDTDPESRLFYLLTDWWKKHIQKTDRDYAGFLRGKGAE